MPGQGSVDNHLFSIGKNNDLKINVSPDFEKRNLIKFVLLLKTININLVLQRIYLSVIDINERPSDLVISSTKFSDSISAGAQVATLLSTDPDADDVHTYSLLEGKGDTDNDKFIIDGNKLTIKKSPSRDRIPSVYKLKISQGIVFRNHSH